MSIVGIMSDWLVRRLDVKENASQELRIVVFQIVCRTNFRYDRNRDRNKIRLSWIEIHINQVEQNSKSRKKMFPTSKEKGKTGIDLLLSYCT